MPTTLPWFAYAGWGIRLRDRGRAPKGDKTRKRELLDIGGGVGRAGTNVCSLGRSPSMPATDVGFDFFFSFFLERGPGTKTLGGP